MQTIVIVDVKDEEGYELGRTVPVVVEYTTHIDKSYGEDGDGRRGVLSIEHELLDVYIEPDHLIAFHSGQVEQVIRDARAAFEAIGPR